MEGDDCRTINGEAECLLQRGPFLFWGDPANNALPDAPDRGRWPKAAVRRLIPDFRPKERAKLRVPPNLNGPQQIAMVAR